MSDPQPDLTHPGLDLSATSDEFIAPDHGPEHFAVTVDASAAMRADLTDEDDSR